MATLPQKGTGSTFLATEFNTIRNKIQQGTDGINTSGLICQTNITGNNIYIKTLVQSDISRVDNHLLQTLPNSGGTIVNAFTAEAIISGGMWVMASGASGTTPSIVAKPAPANTAQPLGICLTTTASGSAPNVLVQGRYKGIIAEANMNVGVGFSMGAGAALNTIKASAAGTTRGTILMSANSGTSTEAIVYLW